MVSFTVVDPSHPHAIGSMQAYFDELDRRFPGGFDPGNTLVDDADALRAPGGAFVVAYHDGRPVGCGGVQRIDDHTGEVKRMWVHPDARGAGLGSRLLGELEAVVATLGYARVVLDTNSELSEAIALYERAGYRAIDAYNDNPYARHWFEKRLSTTTG